jgi:prolyl-tRNA synthetase
MGIPYRVVISDKTLAGDKLELKTRANGETELLTIADFKNKLS